MLNQFFNSYETSVTAASDATAALPDASAAAPDAISRAATDPDALHWYRPAGHSHSLHGTTLVATDRSVTLPSTGQHTGSSDMSSGSLGITDAVPADTGDGKNDGKQPERDASGGGDNSGGGGTEDPPSSGSDGNVPGGTSGNDSNSGAPGTAAASSGSRFL